ncbi:hypothetical protein N9L48_06155 [Psychrosphaera sp.]|nr:hypothetical protein [Psychrosphaera sp.]
MSETQAVLDDLIEESLIKWSSEEIELTNHALENFEEVEGSMLPRFFEVVDKLDTVFFELSEFRMLPRSVQRSGLKSSSLSLPLPDDCYSNLNDKARSSFDSSFEHFREVVKGEDIYADREELYKINHVNSKFDVSIPIPVEFFIDTSAPHTIQSAYEDAALDEWDINKSLFKYMDSVLISESKLCNSISFHDYLTATDDPILIKYWDDMEGVLNTELLLSHFKDGLGNDSSKTQLIVGNLYTEHNSNAIIEKLKEVYDGKPNSNGMIWFTRAESRTWGRTKALGKLVESIYSLFDKRRKTSDSVLVMSCSSKPESYALKKIYRNVEAQLLDCEMTFGGENTEILLIPNVMVACLYHVTLNDERDLTLPVGYVSFAPELIESVTQNIKMWSGEEAVFNQYFENNTTDIKNTVLNKIYSPILFQELNRNK